MINSFAYQASILFSFLQYAQTEDFLIFLVPFKVNILKAYVFVTPIILMRNGPEIITGSLDVLLSHHSVSICELSFDCLLSCAQSKVINCPL